MKTFWTMLKIEGKLSVRDMNMVIFAVVMPVIVLAAIGMIYGSRPAYSGASFSFLQQSFGAVSTIAICAGGVMGLPIMISEYRERKILKRYQVTPVSPAMILSVHLSIYAIYALFSLISLWIMARLFWGFRMRGSAVSFLSGWLLVMASVFSIGVLVGGVARNSKDASVIASALYFPMLIFSGATLPYEIMPPVIRKIADFMPLTQGIKILKAEVLGFGYKNSTVPIAVMTVMMIVCIGASIRWFRWE